jgi:hypothetical protein
MGPDQRITSGPAAKAAAFIGRIHGCTRRFAEMTDFPLAPRAPSIHGTSGFHVGYLGQSRSGQSVCQMSKMTHNGAIFH